MSDNTLGPQTIASDTYVRPLPSHSSFARRHARCQCHAADQQQHTHTGKGLSSTPNACSLDNWRLAA